MKDSTLFFWENEGQLLELPLDRVVEIAYEAGYENGQKIQAVTAPDVLFFAGVPVGDEACVCVGRLNETKRRE